MIRKVGGKALFRIIKADPKTEKEKYDTEIKDFVTTIQKEADPKLLKLVEKTNPDGTKEIDLDSVRVTNPLYTVLDELGLALDRATFGDVILSKPVTDAANQASAEADERVAELADADTKAEARRRMLPSQEELNNPAWETAMVLAEAKGQGPNGAIRVVLVPGTDSITRTAVAGASQIGGSK